MNAIILAGGFGNRLRPLTDKIPKPMLTLYDAPIIDYNINQLNFYGINEISFSLGYLPEKVIEWVLGYKDIKTHFNVEESPLGTCGGVKALEKYLDNTFFVLSGDGLSNINLVEMSKVHHDLKADVTIAVTEIKNPSLYGVAQCDDMGYINYFIEKPQSHIKEGFVNCGVYILNKDILETVPSGFYDFSKNLFPFMLANGFKLAAYIHKGYWNDIGNFENYFSSSFYIKDNKAFYPKTININRHEYEGYRVGIEPQSFINRSSSAVGNIYNCIIGRNSVIASGAVLENCIVESNALVKSRHNNCIITDSRVIDITEYSQINNVSAKYVMKNFK